MTDTYTYWGTLTVIECVNCSMTFGIPEHFEQERRKDHVNFYCPNGHAQHFPQKSVEQKLRAQVAQLEGAVTVARNQAANARKNEESERRRAAAARGQVTKIKKRIGNGVCPCCKRHFTNVERHVKSQHPGFQAT